MATSIKTKRGSSLHRATFSLINFVYLYVTMGSIKKSVYVEAGKSFRGIAFESFVRKAMEPDFLHVSQSASSAMGSISCDHPGMFDLIRPVVEEYEEISKVVFLTAPLDKIRAFAKEIRADKEVENAAKKPAKPKAGLKTRRDVI